MLCNYSMLWKKNTNFFFLQSRTEKIDLLTLLQKYSFIPQTEVTSGPPRGCSCVCLWRRKCREWGSPSPSSGSLRGLCLHPILTLDFLFVQQETGHTKDFISASNKQDWRHVSPCCSILPFCATVPLSCCAELLLSNLGSLGLD